MTRKKQNKILGMSPFQLGVLLLLTIAVIGGLVALQQGWLNDTFNLKNELAGKTLTGFLDDPSSNGACGLDISPSILFSGDEVTGSIDTEPYAYCEVFAYMEGDDIWRKIWEGYADVFGSISEVENMFVTGVFHFRAICDENNNSIWDEEDCLTNEEIVTVSALPPDPTDVPDYDTGDVVDTGSGSGSAGAGEDSSTQIVLDGWTTGGNYILGARIQRSWAFAEECDLPQQYPVTWTLYDSNGMAWQKYDYAPISVGEEVCPLTYHPDAPWVFTMENDMDCNINYEWKVDAIICEVLD